MSLPSGARVRATPPEAVGPQRATSTSPLWTLESLRFGPDDAAANTDRGENHDPGRAIRMNFALSAPGAQDAILYLVAKGGTPKAAANKSSNDAIVLMALLGTSLPQFVTINELTTVASAFTAARFINGEAISGHPLGLRIAAGNVANLVDLTTGGWGKVLLDPLNSTRPRRSQTWIRSARSSPLSSRWPTTVGAPASLRPQPRPADRRPRTPSKQWPASPVRRGPRRKNSTRLFDEAYPLPRARCRSAAPFAPYLVYVPDDFALSLAFLGRRRLFQWTVHV